MRILLFLVCLSGVCTPVAGADEVLEVLKAAVESRMRISSARIALSRSIELDKNPQSIWQSSVMNIAGVLSDGNRRFDIDGVATTKGGTVAPSNSQVIFGSTGGFIYRPVLESDPVEVSKRELDNSSYVQDFDWDLRCLGLCPIPFHKLDEYGLDDVFRYLEMGKPNVTEEGDIVTVVSEFTSQDGVEVNTEWRFRSDQDYSVVYAAVNRSDFGYVVDVKNKKYDSDIWFPESIKFEHVIADAPFYRESITVSAADFSGTINASEFDFEKVELSPGRAVRVNGEYKIWDGKSLLVDPVYAQVAPVLPTIEPRRLNKIYIVNAVVLGCLGLLFLFRFWFRSIKG